MGLERGGVLLVVAKIMGVAFLLMTPLSVGLWWTSHHHPQHRRYDISSHKSLRVLLDNGVCHLRLLDMTQSSSLKSRFYSTLHNSAMLPPGSLLLSSYRQGENRVTLLTFPLWVSTFGLIVMGTAPLVSGPIIRWRRKRYGWCLECGYNLTGNKTGRCPECGMRFRRHKTGAARTTKR